MKLFLGNRNRINTCTIYMYIIWGRHHFESWVQILRVYISCKRCTRYAWDQSILRCITFPLPPTDSIRDMVIVWSIRVKIIRTVLCCIVYHNVLSYMHTHINDMSSSYRWTMVCLFRCSFFLCVFFFLTRASLFVIWLFIVCFGFVWSLFGCQYQCNQLPGKTRPRNDDLYVEWDVKLWESHYSLLYPSIPQTPLYPHTPVEPFMHIIWYCVHRRFL